MNNFRPQPTSPNYRLGSSPLSQGPSYNVDLDYDLPAFPLSEASSPFTPSPKRESSASTQSISSPNHDNIGQNSRRSSLSSGAGNQPRRTPQLVDLTDSPPLRQGRFMGTSNSTSQTSEDRFYPSQRSVQPSSLRQNDLEVAPSRSTVASTSTPRRHRLRRISSSSYSSLESSDMPPRRTSTDGRQSSRKRRRLNPSNAEPEPVHENSEPAQQGTTSLEPTAIEEVDLTLVTNPASLANALSKQREDAVKAQAQTNTVEEDGGRTMLTSYKCPICMDVLEDATSTVCGHLFCHKCIMDTLRFSEQQRAEESVGKPKGTCPVCRKPLARSDKPDKTRTLIPLGMKLQFTKKSKGKGKEVDRGRNGEGMAISVS